jgi:hypothetical protein
MPSAQILVSTFFTENGLPIPSVMDGKIAPQKCKRSDIMPRSQIKRPPPDLTNLKTSASLTISRTPGDFQSHTLRGHELNSRQAMICRINVIDIIRCPDGVCASNK